MFCVYALSCLCFFLCVVSVVFVFEFWCVLYTYIYNVLCVFVPFVLLFCLVCLCFLRYVCDVVFVFWFACFCYARL